MMSKKIWLVHRTDRVDYDEFDSIVVFADTEDEARFIHPEDGITWREESGGWTYLNHLNEVTTFSYSTPWPNPKTLTVEYLGATDRKVASGIILASFNAG